MFLQGCHALQVAAERVDRDARVWRGPTSKGSGVGHVEYVQTQLVSTTEKHKTLCQRIQSVQDWQSAWLLLLFCANTRATYSLRGIPPDEVAEFAAAHDEASWQCFTKLLGFPGARTDTVSPVCHLTWADVGCRAP